MFSVKDSVPQGLRSGVVYKFSCAGYIGDTTRHLCTRAREHLLSDKSSHVYRHLQSSRACHDSCNTEYFTILYSATLKFQIKIKEALHIKRENPILNQQLRHLDLSLPFQLRCSFCLLCYCYARFFSVHFVCHIQIVRKF